MVVLNVSGMTCGGCAATVEKVIKTHDPSAQVTIDLERGRVEAVTGLEAAHLAAAVTAAGFEAQIA